MSSLFRLILTNSSLRILIYVFAMIVGITIFFLVVGYYTQMRIYEKGELEKLSGVANTLALQIDGNMHQTLYEHYPREQQIKSVKEVDLYYEIHKKLSDAKIANKIDSPIYTMVYSKEEGYFDLCVFSDSIYWRSPWKKFRPEHIEYYTSGGKIGPYEDEHGTWLSALAPIKNSKGQVVAAVQVDEQFDDFIWRTRKEIGMEALISLFIIGIVAYILLRSIRGILKKEEALTREILISNQIIEQKNKDITDSIQYAKRIQQAILPTIEIIRKCIPDSFILFLPRDIVSGDFYWFTEHSDRIFIAAVDCTGHGVPGAFMSMIGNTILNEIVNQKKILEPGKILDELDKEIKKALKQDSNNPETRDGMDLALVSICKHFKDLKFSGAFRPLLLVRNGVLSEIKANRFPIGGGGAYQKTNFTTTTVNLEKGDILYLFSDGYPDQIGGSNHKKITTKRFKEILISNINTPMPEQGEILRNELLKWQGENEQMDDILVIGIRI